MTDNITYLSPNGQIYSYGTGTRIYAGTVKGVVTLDHANGYVVKPFGMDELKEIVKSIETFWFNISKLPRGDYIPPPISSTAKRATHRFRCRQQRDAESDHGRWRLVFRLILCFAAGRLRSLRNGFHVESCGDSRRRVC